MKKGWYDASTIVCADSAPVSMTLAIVASMSAPTRNGDVGCSVTTRSGRGPPLPSSQRTACCSTGTIPAWSEASSAGRMNGTSAPWRRASSAMAVLSVETMKRVSRRASRAEATAWPMSGRRPSVLRFLPGNPLEPPRAGMTPKTYGSATLHLHPAPLGGGTAGGVDDLHRAVAVPAVAARRRLPADHGQEVARLLDVHVVELAARRIDFPARGARIVDADLVLHPAPLDDAAL